MWKGVLIETRVTRHPFLNATAIAAPAGSRTGGGHSGWHSPVPYLFGGLAAMLGLIAFALLLLACSYWKLSGYLEGGRRDGGEPEGGADAKARADAMMPVALYEEKIVVIMVGDEKPTYLATPISSRASSFGDRSSKDGGVGEEKEKNGKGNCADCAGGGSDETREKERVSSGGHLD